MHLDSVESTFFPLCSNALLVRPVSVAYISRSIYPQQYLVSCDVLAIITQKFPSKALRRPEIRRRWLSRSPRNISVVTRCTSALILVLDSNGRANASKSNMSILAAISHDDPNSNSALKHPSRHFQPFLPFFSLQT